jgi:hypothetical protein
MLLSSFNGSQLYLTCIIRLFPGNSAVRLVLFTISVLLLLLLNSRMGWTCFFQHARWGNKSTGRPVVSVTRRLVNHRSSRFINTSPCAARRRACSVDAMTYLNGSGCGSRRVPRAGLSRWIEERQRPRATSCSPIVLDGRSGCGRTSLIAKVPLLTEWCH